MTSLVSLLKRGVLSGLLASLVAAGFSYFLAEPLMDRAVNMESVRESAEEARQQAASLMTDHHMEVFSRSTQHAGLILATALTGLALGALFAVIYWLLHKREPHKSPWRKSLYLAGAAFTAVGLIPFLRYPSNPPGVGDPATIGFRTNIWLAAIAVGIASVLGAWRLYGFLTARGFSGPVRQLAAAGLLLTGLAASFALPANPDAIDLPASFLWEFRLLSLATMLLLWAALGITFGLLGRRAAQKESLVAARAAGIRSAG